MSDPDREPDELESEGPAVLPEREAMGILSQAREPEDDDEEPELGDS